ncbi:hypothetical protein [Methylovirgula sp. 4M-Z18]|uniref:hypothetical protein n=1 Tax=Methylovirgula sp. 4M-Z18 TaxID=2293567 RepID=UPI000E2F167C|nr:hypothetical protein [Methylovirgula sp. 4M-Z18]RFB78423.1 hypothetical protein DYH55_16935 [Methylovirgula sp. 4M-Z18]
MSRQFVFGAALVVLMSGAALAQQAAPTVSASGGHRIEKYSVLARAAYQFDKLDVNKQGFLDQSEWNKSVDDYVARYRAEMQRRFAEMDVNHTGKVTKEQFVAARGRWFDAVDTDHSGTIDDEKLRAYRRRERDQAAAEE